MEEEMDNGMGTGMMEFSEFWHFWVPGSEVRGCGSTVLGLDFRTPGLASSVLGLGYRVQGLGF